MIPSSLVVKEFRLKNVIGNYSNLEYVSEGSWGKVYSGIRSDDKKTVALKFFGYTNNLPSNDRINGEIMLMNSLIGVNGVVQMESLFYDTPEGIVPGKNRECLQSYPVIVMEMLSGGHLLNKLETAIADNNIPSESDLAGIFRGVVQALESLHNRNYIHRDLKLENCIFANRRDPYNIKIIDFGSMVQLQVNCSALRENAGIVGSPGYCAPESVNSDEHDLTDAIPREYSYKSDVWQVGCILFTLLCAHPPYYADKKNLGKIIRGDFLKSSRWNALSGAAKDLIQKIFRVDPEQRISLSDILKHPWLTGGAPTHQLSSEYAQKVRSLALTEKLKYVFLTEAGHANQTLNRTQSLDIDRFPSIDLTLDLTQSNTSYTSDPNHSNLERSDTLNTSLSSSSSGSFNVDCRRIFDRLDTDGNGTISPDELLNGIIDLLSQYSSDDPSGVLESIPSVITSSSSISNSTDNSTIIPTTTTLQRTGSRVCPHIIPSIKDIFSMINQNSYGEIDFQAWTFFYDAVVKGTAMIRDFEGKTSQTFISNDLETRKRKNTNDDQINEEHNNHNNHNDDDESKHNHSDVGDQVITPPESKKQRYENDQV